MTQNKDWQEGHATNDQGKDSKGQPQQQNKQEMPAQLNSTDDGDAASLQQDDHVGQGGTQNL
jgi:hypothetical protein